MESITSKAISVVQESKIAFSKFITANDVGATGAHQAGFHFPKNAWSLFFDTPGQKGENKDKFVEIHWQDNFHTSSRFIYYGQKTRNEYRLTRFGRGFPFLEDENIGDLLVLCLTQEQQYVAFVINTDAGIDEFLSALNISTTEVNGIIPRQFQQSAEDLLLGCFKSFMASLTVDFPRTIDIANTARNCFNSAYGVSPYEVRKRPDTEILNWLNCEFQLFKFIENDRYSQVIKKPIENVEKLVELANTILNRRKSRAGRSLEHHLEAIFKISDLQYSSQATTENKKTPDFLFPGTEAYADPQFDETKLITLAAKTTCKDRWRQILNEADRVRIKHLFTLQQGISSNQLKEMHTYGVRLVVPRPYVSSFPKEFRDQIMTLEHFISHVSISQK